MLKTAAYYSLEKFINFILVQDTNSTENLTALEDKVILIEISDLDLKMYWLFENKFVRLLSSYRDETDAAITGPITSITQLGLSKAKIAKDMTITGDLQVIENFKILFASLDIDWEAYLARYTGDALAFKINKTAKQAKKWLKQAAQSLRENSKEYLQEESDIVPSRILFDDFKKDVRALNRQIDKLDLKIRKQT